MKRPIKEIKVLDWLSKLGLILISLASFELILCQMKGRVVAPFLIAIRLAGSVISPLLCSSFVLSEFVEGNAPGKEIDFKFPKLNSAVRSF